MSDLTDFLTARLDEDEADARAWSDIIYSLDLEDRPHAGHRLNPARVLAECEAKRRIVSRCDLVLRGRPEGMFNAGQEVDANDNLRALALPYADHPDYRQEWAV